MNKIFVKYCIFVMGLVWSNYQMKADVMTVAHSFSSHNLNHHTMQEIWKDLPNYENYYQVSNLGKVKSLKRKRVKKDKILKPQLDFHGYLHVALCKNGKQKTKKIHQLVAVAFLNHTTCGMKLVVDHKNFIRTDNRLENLQVITTRENSNQKHIKSTSKYVGVYWSKSQKKWRANITINKKQIHLGVFSDEKEANKYYKNALNCILNNKVTDIKLKRATHSSKYKGVVWNKSINKWVSFVRINGKQKHLGCFINEYDAHLAHQMELKVII